MFTAGYQFPLTKRQIDAILPMCKGVAERRAAGGFAFRQPSAMNADRNK